MIINETNLVVADNSGARSVRVFRLLGGSFRKTSNIGDIVICAVKDAIPNAAVKKGDVDRMLALNAKSCVECGMCSYVCPSHIEVTENMKKAKLQIRLKEMKAAKK